MSNNRQYIPPFTITNEITSLVAEICEIIGKLSALTTELPSPQLRKQNRIKTIQSSLAIENNTLSIEQVTDILEGKRVLGAPNEIKEVKNAIDAYNLLLELNPYRETDLLKAHRLMLSELVKENGYYRKGDVGVFDGTKCILSSLNDAEKSNQKSNQKILAQIQQNPYISIRELKEIVGLSESGIKKILRQLRNDGTIKRVGGAKGGHWEVNES